jgi:hypothetical protein
MRMKEVEKKYKERQHQICSLKQKQLLPVRKEVD